MKSVFLGQSAPFDNGKNDPVVAINAAGGISLIHLDGQTVYHRAGTVNKATVTWSVYQPVPFGDSVKDPDLANNVAGVLAVAKEDDTQGNIFALPGKNVDGGISWGKAVLVDTTGERPAVAMNEAGVYVLLYEMPNYGVMYRIGTCDGSALHETSVATWPGFTGKSLTVALNNRNQYALAHEDGDAIILTTGVLSDGKLQGIWSGRVNSIGSEPSVAITDDGVIIVTFTGKESALRQAVFQLSGDHVTPVEQRHIGPGHDSSVAASGSLAIGVHLHDGDLLFANSLITDRTTWMYDRLGKLGALPLSKLVLPASHDSGMFEVVDLKATLWAKTQDQRVLQQLEDGLRWFDFRLIGIKTHISVHHGGYEGPHLAKIIADIKAFIEAGRRELIVLKFSHYRDFHPSTWKHFVEQMKALDPWMYKKTDLPSGKHLADVTLSEFIGGGSRVVVLTSRTNEALPDGYWLVRDDENDSAAGDIRVYDHYSKTESFDKMKAEQIGNFNNYTGKCVDGSTCDLFLLSWTLTPKDLPVDTEEPEGEFPTIPIPSWANPPVPVVKLASQANPFLGQTVATTTVPNAQKQIMNLLYVDFVENARVCDVALYQLGAPVP